MQLPPNHPQRFILHDEVHARPPEALKAPLRLSFLALQGAGSGNIALQPLLNLAARYNVAPPPAGASHFSADFGAFRLKWERHTEFARYKFIVAGADGDPFAAPAISALPKGWVATLPGQLLVAAHAALFNSEIAPDHQDMSARFFNGEVVIGANIAGGAGAAFTDFRIHGDGFSRWLIYDFSMTQRQAGRLVQRLMELDTYRMMALLAFPVARELAPFLTACERELAEITTAMASAGDTDEPALLDRLTKLEAAIEKRHAENYNRFSATAAYYNLVQRRTEELREERIEGLQLFQEFLERRLAPAMNTVQSASARQQALSERVARATQLLSTRVDITRERQNQAVLTSMNRRAKMQLRLQQTVEGLSIAAITYYIVGLVGYAAKGVKASGFRLDPDIAMAVSIPVIVLGVAMGLRRVRRFSTQSDEKDAG
ncbi:MAG: DUF3422 domain-containing protein [Hyphomicrobiales bacterium]|nr:DUF3422 domain-containing protein [Hyphomicrobiales bacterium]